MTEKRETLVVLIPGFAKDELDTTCLPLQQSFIRALNEKFPGLNVIILAFQYPYTKKTYQWFGNTVVSFNGRNRGGLSKLVLFWTWYKALKKIHHQCKITGLLSFWCNECALIGKRFADKNSIKHICWISGQDAKKENRYPRLIAPRTDELAALSDFLQNEFEKNHGIRPKYVVTPGIDLRQYGTGGKERDIDVLATGSLIPLKQYEIFVEVIDEIRKDLSGLKAVIIGQGPEKDNLISLIERRGLASNIRLTGELPHNEVLNYMKRTKVFLHPSSYEGFVMVCLEALGAGADVVSFVKPMQHEIENWHIAKSKKEMIRKTVGILQDQTKEYKSVIPYTIEQSVQQMAELFSFQ